eukprot:CAMPEP_0116925212 /NCGR_PEP_ID=MMETSP0467-20121206/23984_1 /TAXON_ID=283647 /ORGANISM="Mesodinium pulex, Strain SPMC105" /LENGTH=49 /DNA_ID=CAMNT_0004604213 /DNA_START=983 /DNA_END=1132 /DNA_ORIENTATION=+
MIKEHEKKPEKVEMRKIADPEEDIALSESSNDKDEHLDLLQLAEELDDD